MPLYQIKYQHCGATWYDVWSCACDSECPICHHAIEATSWDELGVPPKEEPVKSAMSDAEYLAVKGLRCPYCRSPEIRGGRVEADGDGAASQITCSACGASWIDDYALTGYTHLKPPVVSTSTSVEGLDMSSYTRFDTRQAMELPGISALKLEFIVQCDQEEAHAFLRLWQMLDGMRAMLDGDIGISHVALNASVVPDDLPF